MRVHHRRCLCALLAAVMLFCSAPICGSAAEENTPITEVVALREENVKHFDLGNGQYHAVSYSYPVHELDSEGNWVDINTALTTGNARIAGQYATEDGRVTVSQTFRPGSQILSMQEDGKGIAMSMVADSSNVSTFSMSRAAVENAPVRSELTEYATIEEAASGDYGSRVYYEDVLPNTDLEYIVDIDMVKENIIVKAPQESYSYTFALDLTGLSAQLEDEGSVSLIDTATQERKYMIPAPYMYDALGNASFDAAYTLTQEENTCYLTVTADAEWINAQGRQFPVTIDPTITPISETSSYTFDTYISSENPDLNFGSSRPLWARYGNTRMSYIKTSPFSLPDGATLSYARLEVYYGYFNYVTQGSLTAGAYRVTMPWEEDMLTYTDAQNYTNFGMSTVLLDSNVLSAGVATLSNPQRADFYITTAVQNWFDGYANYGIALRYLTGTNLSVVFKSSETESIYRPRIAYEYTISEQDPSPGVTVEFLYDTAYENRYSEAAIVRIAREAAVLKEFYAEEFGAQINFSTAQQFSSYFESCPSYSSMQCTCTDTSGCSNSTINMGRLNGLASYHHCNIYNILARIEYPEQADLQMVYIGHPFCVKHNNGNHDTSTPFNGIAFQEADLAAVMYIDQTDEVGETTVMIHEFGHLFGAVDHYNVPAYGIPSSEYLGGDFNEDCIYGENKDSISAIINRPICDGCRERIADGLLDYLQ